jgi:hypothetical protein
MLLKASRIRWDHTSQRLSPRPLQNRPRHQDAVWRVPAELRVDLPRNTMVEAAEGRMKKSLIVLIVEIGMVGGIVIAALVLPRSTPLATFLIVSGAAVVLGYVFLFRQLKKVSPADGSAERRRKSGAFVVSVIVMIAILLLLYFVNRL